MTQIYRNKNGEIHRDDDLPATEYANGSKAWWVNGQLHRERDLPAVEHFYGTKCWYINGQCHREGDLPAIEYVNGTKKWFVNGKRHREGGLPAVEVYNGNREWWVNDKQLSKEKALVYFSFCQKMEEKKRIRAQKKIYFWWIQICYDLSHPSGCGKRMAQKNLISFEEMMCM